MELTTILKNSDYITALKKLLLSLQEIGYCEKIICNRLSLSNISEISWRFIPVYRKKYLSSREPVDCAIDLFLLQGSITQHEYETLLDESIRSELINSDILSIKNQKIVANLSCYPINEMLIFSDHAWPKLPNPGLIDIPHNQVMYIGLDSRWLAYCTSRKMFESALDLCTGSGVHAVLAASHSKHVTAVDINQRSIDYTKLNALSNNLCNIQAQLGDLYENIEGTFELITANPPFVPSPVNTLGYRDGGNDGESVQRRIVQGLSAHLAKNGIAQIITEIGESPNRPLVDTIRSWLGDTPMDIFILRFQSMDADQYAVSHANTDESFEAYFNDIGRWTDNMIEQGYQTISSVLLTFQWSKNPNNPWNRIEDVDKPVKNIGSVIEYLFEQENLLQNDNIFEILKHKNIARSTQIGVLQAREIGSSDTEHKQHAKLMSSPLGFSKWLDTEDLHILEALNNPMNLTELASKLSSTEDILFKKICELIRSGMLKL